MDNGVGVGDRDSWWLGIVAGHNRIGASGIVISPNPDKKKPPLATVRYRTLKLLKLTGSTKSSPETKSSCQASDLWRSCFDSAAHLPSLSTYPRSLSIQSHRKDFLLIQVEERRSVLYLYFTLFYCSHEWKLNRANLPRPGTYLLILISFHVLPSCARGNRVQRRSEN